MKKLLSVLVLLGIGIFVTGCNEQQVAEFKTQYRAIVPPDTFYECPGKPPRPVAPEGKIRDSQVAEYIVRLDRAHSICSRSLQAIRAFANQAKLTVEQQ